jgi:hypothetical protein
VIARHPRSYERENFVFNPLHYLPLLEQKIGALDQAAPFRPEDVLAGVREAIARGAIGLTRSSIWCCAGSSVGHRGSI